MSRAGEILRRFAEVERNCDQHTFPLTVWVEAEAGTKRASIIGGLLRVIALDTDGLCSFRGVTDADLISPSGATFHFQSDTLRRAFRSRWRWYLSDRVRSKITHSEG